MAHARLHLDLDALRANYATLQSHTAAEVGASVKADAYGLGVAQVAPALAGAGCRSWFVATAEEGARLRPLVDGTIYILNGPGDPAAMERAMEGLTPVLNTPAQVGAWHGTGRACALMFDTGMNRLGLNARKADLFASAGLEVALVMSHLASAPDPTSAQNAEQLARFRLLADAFPDGTPLSLANSAGVFLGADYHFDLVRPGIALYGGAAGRDAPAFAPVATVEAPVLQVREVAAGEALGYGATFTAPEPMRVATIGIGYADGLPVALSGTLSSPGGTAEWRGHPLRIVGRVSMDLTLLDATDTTLAEGDTVRFLGTHLADTARRAGTIDYELLVRMGSRLRADSRAR